MSKTNFNEAQKENNSVWFQLKNDKDSAKVQFLFNTPDEIPTYLVHEINEGGKRRIVDCLRNPGDAEDVCPFCKAGMPTKYARFVVLYNHGTNSVQIWERGKRFFDDVLALMARYPRFSNTVFEIVRNGAAGNMQTRFNIYPTQDAPIDLNNVKKVDPLGAGVVSLDQQGMQEYLRTGALPRRGEDNQGDPAYNQVQRRQPVGNPNGF